MASFVREVLLATGNLDSKENILMKANRLKEDIEETKALMTSEMEAKYIHLEWSFSGTELLVRQLENTLNEVDQLEKMVKTHLKVELAEGQKEMNTLSKELKELSSSVEIANQVKQIYEDLEEARELMEDEEWSKACQKIGNVDKIVTTVTPVDKDQELAFTAAKHELVDIQESMSFFLGQIWESKFKIDEIKVEDLKTIKFSLNAISKNEENNLDLVELLNSLAIIEMFGNKICKFAKKFYQEGLLAMLKCEYMVDFRNNILRFEQISNETPPPELVLDNLETILGALKKTLNVEFLSTVDEKNPDNTQNLLSELGAQFFEKFLEKLIELCLFPAIPDNREDLEEFEEIKTKAIELQKQMIDMKFIPKDTAFISQAIGNIDETFAKRRVANFLGKAREIMKENLFTLRTVDQTCMVQDQQFVDEYVGLFKEKISTKTLPDLDEIVLPDGLDIDMNAIRFPKCQVSLHILEFEALLHKTLEEACDSDEHLANKLIIASKLSFELYMTMLENYHNKEIEEIPQLSAIALTNCMYLSHKCALLAYRYQDRVPKSLFDKVIYTDLILKVREVGHDFFVTQCLTQIEHFHKILDESELVKITEELAEDSSTEKSFNQIIMEMNRLKTIWQNVLPSNVYSKAMGLILNAILEKIITQITSMEDISADASKSLSKLLELVQEKAPLIFEIEGDSSSSKHDIVRFVKTWQKFKELNLVLNISLAEIEDRWAEGKGPFAVEFTVEEMKRLIRALFQNTDIRARVLDKIRK